MFDFRLPNITGATPQEQMAQMQNYMRQFVEQLQWALSNIESSQGNVVQATPQKEEPSRTPAVPFDAASAFAALKPLIIKSADIVNAHYEQIRTRMEGAYVAVSDFGVFQEQTSQDILSNSTEIEQSFTNIQEVRTGLGSNIEALTDTIDTIDTDLQDMKEGVENNLHAITGEVGELETIITSYKDDVDNSLRDMQAAIDSLNSVLVEVNAYMRSGLLYEDENSIPVYGIEIGQTNTVNGEEVFNKYARFTSDRLSFYDQNDTEVGYISDRKLYINDIEVLVGIKRGGLKEIILANGDTVEKWVGRG